MSDKIIRVVIIDDSPLVATMLKRMVDSDPAFDVVAVAQDGESGLDAVRAHKPDVVSVDYHMPRMDGLAFIQKLMEVAPTPVLVVSTSVVSENQSNVFRMLEAGAIDVMPKPSGENASALEEIKSTYLTKLRVVSGVVVFSRRSKAAPEPAAEPEPAPTPSIQQVTLPKVLLLGASTGGPQALATILGSLPGQFPLPVLSVQHISEGFLSDLISWLDHGTRLKVRIAKSGEVPQKGVVYFPEDGHHLELDHEGLLQNTLVPPFEGHRPSVNMLFESAARFHSKRAIGVLCTGMGRDGARGLKMLHDLGAYTIAQDEATSVVFGMPREAIALQAATDVLPLPQIGPAILQLLKRAGA